MSTFLQIRGRTKTGLDFLADLWSGRVHRTLYMLHNTLIEFQQWRNEMTRNEQKILDAASVISESADNLRTGVQGLKDTIIDLKNQLGQPVAEEDLSPEFDKLDAALDGLKELSDGLTAHVENAPSDQTSGDASGGSQVPMTSPGEPEAPGTQVLADAVGQNTTPAPAVESGSSSPDGDAGIPSGTGTGTGSNVPPESPANLPPQTNPVPADTETPTGEPSTGSSEAADTAPADTPTGDTPDEEFD